MDPLALATLADSIFGMFGGNQQADLAQAQLNLARKSAADQKELATAPRTDAYGNTISYAKGTGFTTELAPIIKAILDSQSREQLTSLREDAPRQRAASVRKDERSQGADTAYQQAFNDIRDTRRRPESEYKADAILEGVANRDATSPVSSGAISQALRSGNPGAISQISKSGEEAKTSLASAIANAKRSGFGQYAQETGTRDQINSGRLGTFASIANGSDRVALPNNTSAERLGGQQEQALQTLLQTLMGGNDRIQGALSNAGRVPQNNISFAEIFKGLQGLGGSTDYLAEAIGQDVGRRKSPSGLFNDF